MRIFCANKIYRAQDPAMVLEFVCVAASCSQTYPVSGTLAGHKFFIDLYRDWRTTWANIADHLWSAKYTVGIPGLATSVTVSFRKRYL